MNDMKTSHLVEYGGMFCDCENLELLIINMDYTNVPEEDVNYLNFVNCRNLRTLHLTGIGNYPGANFTFDVSDCPWGEGSQESLISLILSLAILPNRISNGYPPMNLKLSEITKAIIPDETKAALALKGYNII